MAGGGTITELPSVIRPNRDNTTSPAVQRQGHDATVESQPTLNVTPRQRLGTGNSAQCTPQELDKGSKTTPRKDKGKAKASEHVDEEDDEPQSSPPERKSKATPQRSTPTSTRKSAMKPTPAKDKGKGTATDDDTNKSATPQTPKNGKKVTINESSLSKTGSGNKRGSKEMSKSNCSPSMPRSDGGSPSSPPSNASPSPIRKKTKASPVTPRAAKAKKGETPKQLEQRLRKNASSVKSNRRLKENEMLKVENADLRQQLANKERRQSKERKHSRWHTSWI